MCEASLSVDRVEAFHNSIQNPSWWEIYSAELSFGMENLKAESLMENGVNHPCIEFS